MSDAAQSLQDAARANVETGVLLLCKEALITAIQDNRLQRTHLRVLACVADCINRKTAKAWPGRQAIARALEIEPVTVSNTLRELRLWGYLIAGRERVAEAGNRSLMVYTFGNVDHETLRREIQGYVDRIKGNLKVTPGGDFQKSPPKVPVTSEGDFWRAKVTLGGGRKSPQEVDSNSEKEPIRKKGGTTPAEYAKQNIAVLACGKLAINDVLRKDLRAEGYSDDQINRALDRAPLRAGPSRDPIKLLDAIRSCASYAKQDDGAKPKQAPALSRWGTV